MKFMKLFVFLPLLFLPALAGADGRLEDPFSGGTNPLAALFCDSNDVNECAFPSQPVEEGLKDSIVTISGKGRCSGVILRLRKGARMCNTPVLLTAGHCTLSHEKPDDNKTIGAFKVGAYVKIEQQHIRPLQKKCLPGHNCLVTPDRVSKYAYTGLDLALVPLFSHNIKRKKGYIPPYEIDIEKVADEKELDQCLRNPDLRVVMTSALNKKHIKKMRKPEPQITENYIQSHSCSRLNWRYAEKRYISKSYLGHRCPTVDGLSGSFMKLECGGKTGLFVYRGHSGGGVSKEIWLKAALKDEIILRHEYENVKGFENNASHIDPELLEYYFDNYCGSYTSAYDGSQNKWRRIQSALAAAGFDPGPADGRLGPRTRRAIEAWQRARGYAATGKLTEMQIEELL